MTEGTVARACDGYLGRGNQKTARDQFAVTVISCFWRMSSEAAPISTS